MKHFFNKITWLFFSFLIYGSAALGQPSPLPTESEDPQVLWDKTFGSFGNEHASVISQAPGGGFLMGGSTSGPASADKSEESRGLSPYGTHDIWIVRIDAEGNKLWDKTIGGFAYDHLKAIEPTEDGGFLLGAFSHSEISGDRTSPKRGNGDFWLVKIDDAGNILWDKGIGGSENETLEDMVATPDGGFLLLGASASPASLDKSQDPVSEGLEDYWVVKIDKEANIEWDKRFGGNSFDYPYCAAVGADGNYLIGGYSYSEPSGDKTAAQKGFTDFWLLKIDPEGNKIWDQTYGGTEEEALIDITATTDGGFLLGGMSNSEISADKTAPPKGYVDYWVVRIDGDGNKLWDKTYGGIEDDRLMSIKPVEAGGFLLGGSSLSGASGDKTEVSRGEADFWLVRIDEAGDILWDKTIGGQASDAFVGMAPGTDGSFGLGGGSNSNASGEKTENSKGELDHWYDYWVVKIELPGERVAPTPTAGFITGLGRFNSPPGAYESSPLMAGKAIFSFSVHHRKWEEDPKGHVLFVLPDERLFFHSKEIEWIAIEGEKAFIKGRGRIGRDESYHFLLSMVDKGRFFKEPKDRFRIIIWEEEGAVLYDNQRGAALYAEAAMPIQHGSITIHEVSFPFVRDLAESTEARQALGGFKVYPTKLQEQGIWLELPATTRPMELQLVLYNFQGRKMAVKAIQTEVRASRQHWSPEIHNWKSGVYLLKIEGLEQSYQQRLIK